MEIEKCDCGKGQVKFECIGEDLFSAIKENSSCKTNKGIHFYYCECGKEITTADAFLTINY